MNGRPDTDGTSPEQRFRRLYGEYHREVYAYLRRRADTETARDAVAEASLVVWRRTAVVPEGAAARPWIYGVARKPSNCPRVAVNDIR